MKKILSAALVVIMLLTICVPALANDRQCELCYGRGFTDCLRCRGLGTIEEYDYSTGTRRRVTCPARCMSGGNRCVRCGGSGRVPGGGNQGGNQGGTPSTPATPGDFHTYHHDYINGRLNSGSSFDLPWYYRVGDMGRTLRFYSGTSPMVTIPYDVTIIRGGALRKYNVTGPPPAPIHLASDQSDAPSTFVTHITFPSAVRLILADAFLNSTALRGVTFNPGSLQEIHAGAFKDCPFLDDVILPGGLVAIRPNAFQNCSGLTRIFIPPSVTNFQSLMPRIDVEEYGRYLDGNAANFYWHGELAIHQDTVAKIRDLLRRGTAYIIERRVDGRISFFANSADFERFMANAAQNSLAPGTPGITTGHETEFFGDYNNSELDIFRGRNPNLTIYGAAGSGAERYARTKGINFMAVAVDGNGNMIGNFPPKLDNASSWARDDIARSIGLGLVPGNLTEEFRQPITRAEFAALAVALYETVTGSAITLLVTFPDTLDLNARKMGALGVVTGYTDGTFRPNAELSRQHAATMLARLADALGKPLAPHNATFTDVGRIASWAAAEVGQMQRSEIMGGFNDGTFRPTNNYTREQSITTILRLFNHINN